MSSEEELTEIDAFNTETFDVDIPGDDWEFDHGSLLPSTEVSIKQKSTSVQCRQNFLPCPEMACDSVFSESIEKMIEMNLADLIDDGDDCDRRGKKKVEDWNISQIPIVRPMTYGIRMDKVHHPERNVLPSVNNHMTVVEHRVTSAPTSINMDTKGAMTLEEVEAKLKSKRQYSTSGSALMSHSNAWINFNQMAPSSPHLRCESDRMPCFGQKFVEHFGHPPFPSAHQSSVGMPARPAVFYGGPSHNVRPTLTNPYVADRHLCPRQPILPPAPPALFSRMMRASSTSLRGVQGSGPLYQCSPTYNLQMPVRATGNFCSAFTTPGMGLRRQPRPNRPSSARSGGTVGRNVDWQCGQPKSGRQRRASMMSRYERNWIGRVMLAAVNFKNPREEDFYYVKWCEKYGVKMIKSKDTADQVEEDSSQSLSSSKSCENKFEGSLGSVQKIGVGAPRRLLTVDEGSLVESQISFAVPVLSMLKKHKALLLYVDNLYLILLSEDTDQPGDEGLAACARVAAKLKKHMNNHDILSCILRLSKGQQLLYRYLLLYKCSTYKLFMCAVDLLPSLCVAKFETEVSDQLMALFARSVESVDCDKEQLTGLIDHINSQLKLVDPGLLVKSEIATNLLLNSCSMMLRICKPNAAGISELQWMIDELAHLVPGFSDTLKEKDLLENDPSSVSMFNG